MLEQEMVQSSPHVELQLGPPLQAMPQWSAQVELQAEAKPAHVDWQPETGPQSRSQTGALLGQLQWSPLQFLLPSQPVASSSSARARGNVRRIMRRHHSPRAHDRPGFLPPGSADPAALLGCASPGRYGLVPWGCGGNSMFLPMVLWLAAGPTEDSRLPARAKPDATRWPACTAGTPRASRATATTRRGCTRAPATSPTPKSSECESVALRRTGVPLEWHAMFRIV